MSKKQFSLVLVATLFSGLVGATLSGWFFLGQVNASTVPGQMRVREIILVDKENRERAGLKMEKDGPVFYFANEEGVPQAVIYTAGSGPTLQFFDKKGKPRLTLGFNGQAEPAFYLYDSKQKKRSTFELDNDSPKISLAYPAGNLAYTVEVGKSGSARLGIFGKNERQWNAIFSAPGRSGFLTTDEEGRPRLGLLYSPKMGGGLSLMDKKGIARLVANVSPTKGPKLTMLNKDKTQVLACLVDPKAGPQVTMVKGKAAYVAGVMGSMPFFSLRHPGGSALEAVFTHLGQPYLSVKDHGKKLWSVPAATPPGVQEIKIHSLTK
jgi:hypothetical protein